MIDNLKGMLPATEKGCRLAALMESGGLAEVDLSVQKQPNFMTRRRRLNVRRLKSPPELPENFNVFAAGYRYDKKKKPDNNTLTYGIITHDGQVQLEAASSEVRNVRESLVTCWSHGSISLIGRRREMEDAVSVNPGFLTKGSKKYDYFGVYDGHGGSRVAHACRDFLYRLVKQQLLSEEDGDDKSINWEKVMKESFCKMDGKVNEEGTEMTTMGSTAVVAVVGEQELIVANCGDSRAVLSRAGVAVPLSVDHKPDRPDELDRIENSGGKVINWNGQRVLGVLATSRSIGDMYLKPYVIPDPEVRVSKISYADEFIILASDGLWDVIPNDVACDVTRRCLNGQMMRRCNQQSGGVKESLAVRAASFLAELAIARGSRDNISVIVVELNRSVCLSTTE